MLTTSPAICFPMKTEKYDGRNFSTYLSINVKLDQIILE